MCMQVISSNTVRITQEDHMIHWMRRWHIGASLMGENVYEGSRSYIADLEDLLWIPNLV